MPVSVDPEPLQGDRQIPDLGLDLVIRLDPVIQLDLVIQAGQNRIY
jgi:hypothetical protein